MDRLPRFLAPSDPHHHLENLADSPQRNLAINRLPSPRPLLAPSHLVFLSLKPIPNPGISRAPSVQPSGRRKSLELQSVPSSQQSRWPTRQPSARPSPYPSGLSIGHLSSGPRQPSAVHTVSLPVSLPTNRLVNRRAPCPLNHLSEPEEII